MVIVMRLRSLWRVVAFERRSGAGPASDDDVERGNGGRYPTEHRQEDDARLEKTGVDRFDPERQSVRNGVEDWCPDQVGNLAGRDGAGAAIAAIRPIAAETESSHGPRPDRPIIDLCRH